MRRTRSTGTGANRSGAAGSAVAAAAAAAPEEDEEEELEEEAAAAATVQRFFFFLGGIALFLSISSVVRAGSVCVRVCSGEPGGEGADRNTRRRRGSR